MYCPKSFEQHSVEAMHELMRAYPLATLITQTQQGMDVNHIPMHFTGGSAANGCLSGHIPRSNAVWQEYVDGSCAIAVFHGPQAYITPSWYASKQQHGKVVPTWNYATVHAHGPVNFIDDPHWLMSHLVAMTDQMESSFAHPWSVSDAPSGYMETMIDHLVGLEIPIEKLQGKWKASQNRSAVDRTGVANGLIAEGDSGSLLMAKLITLGDR